MNNERTIGIQMRATRNPFQNGGIESGPRTITKATKPQISHPIAILLPGIKSQYTAF